MSTKKSRSRLLFWTFSIIWCGVFAIPAAHAAQALIDGVSHAGVAGWAACVEVLL